MPDQHNVAFFNAPGSPLRVDFLRVEKSTMRKLLDSAIRASVRGYVLVVPALRDLICRQVAALRTP